MKVNGEPPYAQWACRKWPVDSGCLSGEDQFSDGMAKWGMSIAEAVTASSR